MLYNNTNYLLLPEASTATPIGLLSVALVAWPLSPEKLDVPIPARFEMILVEARTLRMR